MMIISVFSHLCSVSNPTSLKTENKSKGSKKEQLSSKLKTEWAAQTQLSFAVFQWLHAHLLSLQCYIKLFSLFYCHVTTGLQLQYAPT